MAFEATSNLLFSVPNLPLPSEACIKHVWNITPKGIDESEKITQAVVELKHPRKLFFELRVDRKSNEVKIVLLDRS